MRDEVRDLLDDPAARLGLRGGALVSLWALVGYVAVPLVTGQLVRDAFFLVEASMVFFDHPVWYHVAALSAPAFFATVGALVRYDRGETGGWVPGVKILSGITLIPVLAVWVLMDLWVLLVTVALVAGPDITIPNALSSGALYLFGGVFFALVLTPAVAGGAGAGAAAGYLAVAAGRRFPVKRHLDRE